MFVREYNETKGSHLDDICVNVGYLIDLVSNSVHINAARVGQLTKITVPGSKQFHQFPGRQRPGQSDYGASHLQAYRRTRLALSSLGYSILLHS